MYSPNPFDTIQTPIVEGCRAGVQEAARFWGRERPLKGLCKVFGWFRAHTESWRGQHATHQQVRFLAYYRQLLWWSRCVSARCTIDTWMGGRRALLCSVFGAYSCMNHYHSVAKVGKAITFV